MLVALLGILCPSVARIQAASSAVLGIGESILTMDALMSSGTLAAGAATLGSLSIVNGLFGLASIFCDDGDNDGTAAILEALQQLFDQIEGLRQEMHSRFDRLEDILFHLADVVLLVSALNSTMCFDSNKQFRDNFMVLRVKLPHASRRFVISVPL